MRDAPGTAQCGYRSRSPKPPSPQPAARTKDTYLPAHHAHIRGRRGIHKAIGATRHDILIAYYHIVRDKVPYQDLGPDWNNRHRSTEQQTRRLVRQLKRLRLTATLKPAT